MVEITSTTTTFGEVDEILPGVARTSTIARSKRLATMVDTVEPLFIYFVVRNVTFAAAGT